MNSVFILLERVLPLVLPMGGWGVGWKVTSIYQLPKPETWDYDTSLILIPVLTQCIIKLPACYLQNIHFIFVYFIPYLFFFMLVQAPHSVYSIATFPVFMLFLLPLIICLPI